jgi:signal transduction histidine kinase
MLFNERPLTVECDADLVAVGDPVQIERVLQNLLWNAAKHTPPATHVTLSARAEGGGVVLSVADDGPGIPEEELRHLGERFYRGGDLNARSTKGLGLGLALVKEILELHGSALEIESQVGIGSRFAFRLLAAKPDDEEAAPAQPSRYDATVTQGRP